MDHALQPHGQFAQRRWCADGQRLKELAREFQGSGPSKQAFSRLEECKGRAKWV
jgi:hypothetical protein